MGQRQIVDIPVSAGLHQKTSEPWLDPSSQFTVVNAIWTKQNGYEKRPGYLSALKTTLFPFTSGSTFAWAPTSLTKSPALLPAQQGYAVTDGTFLYAGSAAADINSFLDYVPPCVATRKQVATSPNGAVDPTVAEWSGGIRVFAWTDNTTGNIYFSLVETATNETIQTGQVGQGVSIPVGGAPQLLIMGSWAVCFYVSGSTIQYSSLNLAALTSSNTWSAPASLVTDKKSGGYDVAFGLSTATTSTAVLTYVNATTAPVIRTVLLVKSNTSATVSPSLALSVSSESGVNIGAMGCRYNSTTGRIWLTYVNVQGSPNPTLIRATTFLAAWNGTSYTALSVEQPAFTVDTAYDVSPFTLLDTLWIGVEDVTIGTNYYACVVYSDASTVAWAVIDHGGGTSVGPNRGYGLQLLSKPFAVNDSTSWCRVYALVSDFSDQPSQFLAEFDINPRGAIVPRPCGSVTPRLANATTNPTIVRSNQASLSGVTNVGNRNAGAYVVAGTITQTSNVPANLTAIGITLDFAHPGRFVSTALAGLTYTAGGIPSVFDGLKVVESSTLYPTAATNGTFTTSTTGGGLTNGQTYFYVIIPEWRDLQGNVHQGQPSAPIEAVMTGTGATGSVSCEINMISFTRKAAVVGLTSCGTMYLVPYRTAYLNGAMSTTFFRLVGDDPGSFYVNDPTLLTLTFSDTASDASIASNQVAPTTGGVLENDAPSSFAAVCAHQERIYGIGDDLHTIWISTAQVDGVPCTFNDTAQFEVTELGDLTALWSMDANLFVASASGIAYVSGAGPNTTGTQSDLSPVTLIPTDVGCIDPRAVCVTPIGTVFRTRYGLALLDRSLSVHSEFGDPVVDLLNQYPTTPAIILHPTRPEIHVYASQPGTAGTVLVYNYRYSAWSQLVLVDPDTTSALVCASALSNGGSLYVANETGRVSREKVSTDSAPYYDSSPDMGNNWITMAGRLGYVKPGGTVQGQGYVHNIEVGFTVQDWCNVGFTMAYDYTDQSGIPGTSWEFSSAEIAAFTNVNNTLGSQTQILLKPKQTWCGAFSFGFFDQAPFGSPGPTTGQGIRVTSVSAEIEAVGGNYRVPTAQRG